MSRGLRARVALPRWYATSPVPDWLADRPGMDPQLATVHAKELGTARTACGERAESWFQYWKEFRVIARGRACRACLSVLGGRRGGEAPESPTPQPEPAPPSMARVADLHHIGIATQQERHDEVVSTLTRTLGGTVEFEVEDDPLDVAATWVLVSMSLRFEVVSPRSGQDTAVTRFLDRTGGGLHHISLGTQELGVCKELVAAGGGRVIGENDDHGGWAEFFLDPRQTGGALLHWMQEVSRLPG